MSEPEPKIIPRAEHPISRRDIDVDVLKVLYRLHHAGYKAYLVGGSVRDLWLGKRPKDFDVVTDAHPQEIRRLFRNSRIIGRRFRLVHVFFKGGKIVEVSTFRSRSEFDADLGILPENNTFGTPAEDAQRRDLTINALFYNIADFSVIDYVGGREDLERRLIRVIGPPEVRFQRDPVRMLRVVRHAARTGFTIDPAAWEAIKAMAPLIRCCSPARVRDELLKDFRSGSAAPFFRLLQDCGLLAAIFPYLTSLLTPEALQAATARLVTRLEITDQLVQAGVPLSDACFWAVFLMPFLAQAGGKSFLDLEPESWAAGLSATLAPLEVPRARRDEILLLWSTAQRVAEAERRGRRLAARIRRRLCFPEACLLWCLESGLTPETLAPVKEQKNLTPILPAVSAPGAARPRRRRAGSRRKKSIAG